MAKLSLREALDLAWAHIGWCWDQIEENTRLRREGSAAVHKQITAVMGQEPAGYTLSVCSNSGERLIGTHVVWWAKQTYWSDITKEPVPGKQAAKEQADSLNAFNQNRGVPQTAVVVPLFAEMPSESTTKFRPHSKFGDLMTIEEFTESVKAGCFIDDDGIGYYATATEESNVPVSCWDIAVAEVGDVRISGVPEKPFTHVIWFNK